MSWRLQLAVVGVLALLAIALAGCQPRATEVAAQPGESQAEAGHEHDHEAEKPATQQEQEKKPSTAAAKKMLESDDARAQAQAVEALVQGIGMLSGAEAQEALAELGAVAASSERPLELRRLAIVGLSLVIDKNPEAATIIKKLAADQDPQIRQAVVEVLERLEPSPVALEIAAKLTQDTDPVVRAHAVRVHTLLKAAASKGKAYAELISALGNPEGDSSAQAAIKLIVAGGDNPKAVLPPLLQAFSTSPNARQRHAIALCIAMICAGENPQQRKFGQLAMTTKKVAVRLHPALTEGVPPLLKALRDPDHYVREIAAQGLGYIGDPQNPQRPLARLFDKSPSVRRRAASALITVPAKAAQPALERAAKSDPDPAVRRYAVEALGWIEDSSVVPSLIAAASDPSARVRRFAAQELGRRSAPEALEALVSLFSDPDPDVRWQAVLAVGKLRDKRAMDALIAALNDPVPQVSNAAERALQRLGVARSREKYLEQG